MATNVARSDGIGRRNELLTEQNGLLREQNNLLRQMVVLSSPPQINVFSSPSSEHEVFVENIDHDEVRDGFLVTSRRKKLWNVQIGLINEFARICKKYNLRWFAIGGTLLGAVRHKGFIPWDDDVDLIMFRPDYEKFKHVAAQEIKAPYFVDNWYNYRLESEGASLNDDEGDFQFITEEQQNRNLDRISHWPLIKIRDNRTTMIESYYRNFINQGIWIDIFPLDPVPPFTQESHTFNFEVAKILLSATIYPQTMKKAIQNNKRILNDCKELEKFLALPYRERGRFFDNFMNQNFFISEYVSTLLFLHYNPKGKPYSSKSFADVICLPFEKIEIPAPAGYDSILTSAYGDWRKPVFTHTHAQIYSTEIPWREYFRKTTIK